MEQNPKDDMGGPFLDKTGKKSSFHCQGITPPLGWRLIKLSNVTALVVAAKFLLPFGKKGMNLLPPPLFTFFLEKKMRIIFFHRVTKHVFLSIAWKRAENCLYMVLLPEQGHSHKLSLGAPPSGPHRLLPSKQQWGLPHGHTPLGRRPSACHPLHPSDSPTCFFYHIWWNEYLRSCARHRKDRSSVCLANFVGGFLSCLHFQWHCS